MYIAEELPSRGALELRTGLLNAVSSALTEASINGYHPDYSYNGKPAGTMLKNSIGEPNSWDFRYLGSSQIRRIGIDDSSTAKVGTKASGRDYPALVAIVEVEEMVDRSDVTVPLADSPVDVCHDGIQLLDRTFTYQDGSDC